MDFLQYQTLKVKPAKNLEGKIVPPASKSYSARAVLASSLAAGQSEIENISSGRNVYAMIESCREVGAQIEFFGGDRLVVNGPNQLREGAKINPGNSGVVLRLLLGVASTLRKASFKTPFTSSLGNRSNAEMVDALRALGVKVDAAPDGLLPITVDGSNLHGGHVAISSRRSSQFLSGLLFLGGLLDEPLEVTVPDELRAPAPVKTTLDVLAESGVPVEATSDYCWFKLSPDARFRPSHYVAGSDPASTAALLALASILDSNIDIEHNGLPELDGVLEYLEGAGVSLERRERSVRVYGGGKLLPQDFDGALAPDAVLSLAALAAHANGTSRFRNIEHIRYKECDRISDFRRELEKAGVTADEETDELIIHGSETGVKGNVSVDSHHDHAVVMAMTLVALRSRHGLTINNPQYVAQTYPRFFDDLERLGGTVKPPI